MPAEAGVVDDGKAGRYGAPPVELLIASIVALALGPPLLKLAAGSGWGLRLLDGFIYVAIGGLVLLHVLPEAIHHSGWWALLAAGIGMAGPSQIEHRLKHSAKQAHAAALFLACIGLGLHGLMDGIALGATGDASLVEGLGLAVVLHRLPVGITLWWLIEPARGARTAAWVLAAMALATVLGFVLGGSAAAAMDSPAMGLFYAFVGGSLLHVVLHRPHPVAEGPAPPSGRFVAGVGGLLGFGLLAVLHSAHVHVEDAGFWALLLDLVLASAPALVLAYLAAGLVQSYLPHASIRWMGRGGPASQSLRGVVFGLPLPICSCGVIPLYRSLIVQGAPTSAALAFLVATPELGLDAILLSLPLLGGKITLARVVCAAVVALLVGWGIGRFVPPHPTPTSTAGTAEESRGWRERLPGAIRAGFGDVVDDTAPWILAGLVIAAALQPALDSPWLRQLPDNWEVLLFALVGMPAYVCAAGATPLVAVLVAGGVSPGAGIAFLLAGPATNVTTFGILSQLHGRRVAVAFGLAIIVLCVALGTSVNLLMPDAGQGVFGGGHGEDHGVFQLIFGLVLAALFVASLLRLGPRGFFGKLGEQGGSHEQDEHDPCDGPDEGGGTCHDCHCGG
jgi:uncharacterized protein